MRILLLSQWCTPEPAFKSVPFAKSLMEYGHSVRIITGFPNYPTGRVYPGYRIRPWQFDTIDGIPVLRVALYPNHDQSALRRLLNYCSFAFSVVVVGVLLAPKADLLVVYHPPTTIFLPALLFKWLRGIPFVIDINDIWPHQLSNIRGFRRTSLAYKLVDLLCRIAYRQASGINAISSGYIPVLQAQGVSTARISIIQNWCREELMQDALRSPDEDDSDNDRLFTVLFAGNMGYAQAMDSVIDAAEILGLRNCKVEFHFVGEGIEKPRLESRVDALGLGNVRFFPGCDQAELAQHYRSADLLLVHLRKDRALEVAIPSKIYDYLFVGKPILAAVRGSAAELVSLAGAGVSCEPENPERIADSVESLSKLSAEKLREFGNNGRQYYLQKLSRKRAIQQFNELFIECAWSKKMKADSHIAGDTKRKFV